MRNSIRILVVVTLLGTLALLVSGCSGGAATQDKATQVRQFAGRPPTADEQKDIQARLDAKRGGPQKR